MRPSISCSAAALVAALALAAPANAHVAHTVESGETLWSIAAASNLTTRALAAANGLSEDSQVVAGSTIQVPSEQEAAAALAGSPLSAAVTSADSASASAGAPQPLGGYTVQAGDTLSSIAARSGATVGQVAWMNGIDPDGTLLAGTVLKLPTGSPLAAEAPPAPAAPTAVPNAEPYATTAHVTAADIGQVATANGVSPSLAAALAWQESGFNNGFVSGANARGVMQLLPGTWTWVEDELAGRELDPHSAIENVRAGVLYLRQLIQDAGGDPARALAYYYQGAASVHDRGLLPETERYVDDVMALTSRFGG